MIRTVFGRTKIKPFIAVFDTTKTSSGSSASNQIILPLNYSNTLKVDWGDGNIVSYTSGTISHVYSSNGTYTINISGTGFNFNYNNTGDRLKILEVKNWGNTILSAASFFGCANLILDNVADVPKLDTNISSCFSGCSKIITINKLNLFDYSLVTQMGGLFNNCIKFNPSIFTINAPICTIASVILQNCNSFNPTTFSLIIPQCTSFVYGFTGLNVFSPSSFYLDIRSISSVNNLLSAKPSFNPSSFYINCANATDLESLFNGNSLFNPTTSFTMVTTSATNMKQMLFNCTNFNQSLNFETQNVLSMANMIQFCTAFNQDISNLNFNKNVFLDNILYGKTSANYNAAYYSNLLIKLSAVLIGVGRTQTKIAGFGSIKRDSTGTSARAALVADGWTINDGGI